MQDDQGARVSAIAALDEPTRRRLYDHVVAQPDPVSRDDAAVVLQLPRTTVAFHLDRLVEQRLLDVVFERRTGRTGPGAGRPAKLYRRSAREVAVSLPERHYGLAGQLLAGALEEVESRGGSPRAALIGAPTNWVARSPRPPPTPPTPTRAPSLCACFAATGTSLTPTATASHC